MSDPNRPEPGVRGRGNLEASYETAQGGVFIRLDDLESPEFWAEVWIPYALLQSLYENVSALRQGKVEKTSGGR